MKKIVVLSGAGISAESGISTFRDAGGLWENYDIMEVASIDGWHKNPGLVLDFYNARRRQLHEVHPNPGHTALVNLESHYHVRIITQNVDDLHERAGSSNILHLHGELFKARSTKKASLIYEWKKDILLGDACELGSQLRPHIVWFGEMVPMIEPAALEVAMADVIIVVGTSLQVYPAAGLLGLAQETAKIFYVDPKPSFSYEMNFLKNLKTVSEKASTGIPKVVDELLSQKLQI
ncbi:MAG: NAD-dependent deacylase [Saprospiraceae bacterium]|nr:NAD-dependent deacylase [Saprospiraceae bacterium]